MHGGDPLARRTLRRICVVHALCRWHPGARLGLGRENGEQLGHDDAVQACLHSAACTLQHHIGVQPTLAVPLKQAGKACHFQQLSSQARFGLGQPEGYPDKCTLIMRVGDALGPRCGRTCMLINKTPPGQVTMAKAGKAAPGTFARSPPHPLHPTLLTQSLPAQHSPRAQCQRLRCACAGKQANQIFEHILPNDSVYIQLDTAV